MTNDVFLVETLPAFSIIGKEGTTQDPSFQIERLWAEAENHFPEVARMVLFSFSAPVLWGVMSDFSRQLKPWEKNYQNGLYLAGYQLLDSQLIPPEGWQKWDIPARDYFVEEIGDDYSSSFKRGIASLTRNGFSLSGAPMDYSKNGRTFIYFPIEALS
jgi:hypothetical protein